MVDEADQDSKLYHHIMVNFLTLQENLSHCGFVFRG